MLLMVEHILKLSFDIIKISSLKISEVSLYNGIILNHITACFVAIIKFKYRQ